jgi:hypothetical protein
MYNATLRHIHATIFPVVNQLTLHILSVYCSLRYTACNARAILSSVASPALQYLSTLSQKRHNFRKKLLGIQCMTSFSLQLPSESFLIVRRTERDMIKNVRISVFM